MCAKGFLIGTAFASLGFLACNAQAGDRRESGDRFFNKDGETQAKLDADLGKPIKIYSSVSNGFIPGWQSPGLSNCEPPKAANIFSIVPEAGYQEGARLSVPSSTYESALRFMSSYNRAVLKYRGDELRRFCPKVRAITN